jgi:hypothetical protein
MYGITRQLAFGLLALLLTSGCAVHRECEITCSDGLNITIDDECEDTVTFALANQHGTCVAEEHEHLCVIPWCG